MALAGAASAADFPEVKVDKINDRVYALLGPLDPPNKENRGYMNNSLVVIGERGVILVDAGSHRAVAEHIDLAIKRVTAKPVTHVLITHHHPDHHLGVEYFKGAEIIATDYTAQQIRENGPSMVDFMSGTTGLDLRDVTPVVPPRTIPRQSRQMLAIDGVRVELISPAIAHTEGDLMVWLPDEGVLAAGDILVHLVTPRVRDGNLKSWIGVVDNILAMPLNTVMPGHGPLMRRNDVVEFRNLIADFYSTIEGLYKSGGKEWDVRKKLDMARWERLARYSDLMGLNISDVWRQVEEENF